MPPNLGDGTTEFNFNFFLGGLLALGIDYRLHVINNGGVCGVSHRPVCLEDVYEVPPAAHGKEDCESREKKSVDACSSL